MGGRCYVSVVKRQKLDAAIDAASASVAEGKSLVQVFMIQEAVRREAEKEEKRLERERYEAEKEERRLERESGGSGATLKTAKSVALIAYALLKEKDLMICL